MRCGAFGALFGVSLAATAACGSSASSTGAGGRAAGVSSSSTISSSGARGTSASSTSAGGHAGGVASSSSTSSSSGAGGASASSSSISSSNASASASSASSSAGCAISSSSGTALFGYAGPSNGGQMRAPGVAVIGRYVATSNATVGHLNAYINGGTTTELLLGLYDDVGGGPGKLLTSATATSFQLGTWVTVATPQVAVTQGTTYWIAVLSPVMSGTFWSFITETESNVSCADTQNSASTSLSALPDPWGTAGQDFPMVAALLYASP